MTNLVSAEDIEYIVGVRRHPTQHWAKAVSGEKKVYILHSAECRDSGRDLRECPFSLALDQGIDPNSWVEDAPVEVAVFDGILCMVTDGDGPSW